MTCEIAGIIPGCTAAIVATGIAALLPAAAIPVDMAMAPPAAATLGAAAAGLVPDIETWLDSHVPFAPKPGTPEIRLIDANAAHAMAPFTQREDLRVRGLYDPALDTVYLVRPWSADDVHDVSTLVHELAHRRQAGLADWNCSGAEELSAYRVQEAWLGERGQTGRTDWFSAALAAQCGPRDIHP